MKIINSEEVGASVHGPIVILAPPLLSRWRRLVQVWREVWSGTRQSSPSTPKVPAPEAWGWRWRGRPRPRLNVRTMAMGPAPSPTCPLSPETTWLTSCLRRSTSQAHHSELTSRCPLIPRRWWRQGRGWREARWGSGEKDRGRWR